MNACDCGMSKLPHYHTGPFEPGVVRESFGYMIKENILDTTNPKDLIGVKKVPLGLLPAAGKIYGALAMEFGAYRAGPKGEGYKEYNWRANKVKLSIYLDAIERHLLALRDGEDFAEDSKVHHLGHIIAGASIVADALEGGQLIDDRPMKGPAAKVLERLKK